MRIKRGFDCRNNNKNQFKTAELFSWTDFAPSRGHNLYCNFLSHKIIVFFFLLQPFETLKLFRFLLDPSRSIPTSWTDQNPQTEGLRLPEGDKRQHNKRAEQKSVDNHERTCGAQQPSSDKPQTVTSVMKVTTWRSER